jgi:hypothetical protein
VCLPEGLYYGRVDREAAGTVLDEHFGRRIHLDHYRGRSIYTFPVQAAERWLREQHDLTGIDELTLAHVERTEDAVDVTFTLGGEARSLHVEWQPGDLTLLTCHSETPKRPPRFVVSPA